MKRFLLSFWPALVCVALVAGVFAQTYSYPTAESFEPYHRRVAEAMRYFPDRVGDWVKTEDVPLNYNAEDLLRPNIMISRLYRNEALGLHMHFMFYQSKNAEHMRGHYPPICYPNNGYNWNGTEPGAWRCGDQTVDGAEHTFRRGDTTMLVANFVVLPDGRFVTDNHELSEFAANRRLRYYGAGQVQMVFYNPSVSEEDRRTTYEQFLAAAAGAIEVIQSGVER